MEGIDYTGLDDLERRFESALKGHPARRREMHEKVGDALRGAVRAEVPASGVNDGRGRVRNWQERFIGTGGGYASVRPVGEKEGHKPGRNSPGAITRYLESGHKVRGPMPGAKRARKSRASAQYTRKYGFYASARSRAQAVAFAAAEEYAGEIAERLGG